MAIVNFKWRNIVCVVEELEHGPIHLGMGIFLLCNNPGNGY